MKTILLRLVVTMALVAVAGASGAAPSKEEYRKFALSHPGDAAQGKRLFNDLNKLACAKCHAVDAKTAKVAPDLSTVGDKFARAELIDAVLNPSAQIAIGYSTTIVTTKNGDVIDGIIKDATDDQITLVGVDAAAHTIRTSEIAERRVSNVSMMPEGLQNGVTLEDFADLTAYVSSLRLPASVAAAERGMPATIRHTAVPVALVPFHSEEHRFNHPAWFGQIPGKPGLFLICEHETGKIWLLDKNADGEHKTLFADLSHEIHPSGATGLLGLAFHPDFAKNHRYFVQHEKLIDGKLYALVSERAASEDFKSDASKPSLTILQLATSTNVHSGGGIDFGPDGFLYVAMGDTGPQGDPQGHGQNLSLPLGKMLRIDVNHQEDGKPYAIPADNPFRQTPDARPEIFAYGFREPWRFSFDPVTGDLWVGDVGQDLYEEVDIVRKGENYGWNVYEGFEPYSNKYRRAGEHFVPPIFAWTRKYGASSTGGFVYRGKQSPSFYGVYIFGDYQNSRIFALTQENRVLKQVRLLATAPEHVVSFGQDNDGELYAVGYEGTIYHIDLSRAKFE